MSLFRRVLRLAFFLVAVPARRRFAERWWRIPDVVGVERAGRVAVGVASPSLMRLWLALACMLTAAGCSRYSQLRGVVQRNVGFAHFTRGMNRGTIDALARRVTVSDVPLLVKMLDDRDRVVRLTAANVLGRMRPEGVDALVRAELDLKQQPTLDVT